MFSFTASVDGQRLAQSGAQGGGQTGQVVVTSAGQIQGQVVGGHPKYTRHSSVANIHHEGASSGSSQDGHLVGSGLDTNSILFCFLFIKNH